MSTPQRRIHRFDQDQDVDVLIYGDETRFQLADSLVEAFEDISKKGIKLLEAFIHVNGEFYLTSVTVFESRTSDHGDFLCRFDVVSELKYYEYIYTYFDVYYNIHNPSYGKPYSPFKFTVGFW